jgi:glycine/D-amino acid oxidase-like deaminating enzyme
VDATLLKKQDASWKYDSQSYQYVVFADGFYGTANPFFMNVPFNPCKGEILVVKIPGLNLNSAIHKKVVLLPIGSDTYICGATYEWEDMSFHVSEKGRSELEKDLVTIIGKNYSYEIIDQKAGVRPAISDRRPVVGWHPVFNNIGIVNGFGSRGLMVGPAAVANLVNNLLDNEPILSDWNISRFKKRLLRTN